MGRIALESFRIFRLRRAKIVYLGMFHTLEGAGGRWLAFGSRSGAAQVVSRRVLADGSKERAKEISKKTYEVFFQGHSRLRRE